MIQKSTNIVASVVMLTIVGTVGDDSDPASYRPVWYTLVGIAAANTLVAFAIPREVAGGGYGGSASQQGGYSKVAAAEEEEEEGTALMGAKSIYAPRGGGR